MNASHTLRQWSLLLAPLILAACDSAPLDESRKSQQLASCVSMTGSSVADTSQFGEGFCVGCVYTDLAKAADGDLETFASITIPALAGGRIALRASAPDGVIYPAGLVAGVVADITQTASAEFNRTVSVISYQDDVAQDQSGDGNRQNMDINGTGHYNLSQSLATKHPFDALEYTFDTSFADNVVVRIYEFCSETSL